MTDGEELDPRNVTFSQAQGYEALPGPLALGEISKEARTKLWDLLASTAWGSPSGYGRPLHHSRRPIFAELHLDFLKLPADEFNAEHNKVYKNKLHKNKLYDDKLYDEYRALILDSLSFNKVFDLFQMIMRHPECPPTFTTGVAEIFVRCRLAYVVDIEKPATILPAATKQEGEVIVEAIGEFREAGLHGSEAHLRKAAALINSGDWPGAIRESTHAVESVARQLAPDASSTLGPALTALEETGRLHPALKKAFSNLYGYASDEEGIRHSLIDDAESPAGQDEAVFMLGACASFASYLWRKHRTGS